MRLVLDTNVRAGVGSSIPRRSAFADRRRVARRRLPSGGVGFPGRRTDAYIACDPKNDVPILAMLIGAAADFIVTGDKDLLSVAGAFPILTPAEFEGRFLP